MSVAKSAGARLTELRRSGAAGRHDSRPRRRRTRATELRAAIRHSKGE